MKKLGFLLLSAVFCFYSCYDDSSLKESIADLDKRVETLEQKVQTNVTSIAEILKLIEEKDFVTGVEEIKKGDLVVGYEIKRSKGESIKIYNGPSIGVKKDNDDIYYWTTNGEWMLADGEKVRASAKDGKDAVLPEVKIEEGKWFFKLEGGDWMEMGQATGDSFFKDVQIGENDVTITLAGNEQSFVLPLKGDKLEMSLNIPEKPLGNATVTVYYTLKGTQGKTTVKALCQNGWSAKVTQKTYTTGEIAITAPEPVTDDEIIILVNDEAGKFIMKSISWKEDEVLMTDVDNIKLPLSAGRFSLTIDTNIEYEFEISQEWIRLAPETKAIRTDVVEFEYDENFTVTERNANIIIKKAGAGNLLTVTVSQEKGKYSLKFLKDGAEITSAASTYELPVKCQEIKEWTATSDAEWAVPEIKDNKLFVTVTENAEEQRNTYINISSEINGITYADKFYLRQLAVNPVPDMLDAEIQDDGTAKDLSARKVDIFTKASETLSVQKEKVLGRNAAIFTTDFGMTSKAGYTFNDYSFRPLWEDGYSLEAYVMCGVTPNGKESKALSSTRSGGTALMISNKKDLAFIYNGNAEGNKSTWHFVYSGIVPVVGQWYHILGTWDQKTGDAKIYVDGKKVKEINDGPVKLVHNSLKEDSYMTIGANSSAGTFDKPTLNGGWNGGIAAARIYSKALSEEEARAAYVNMQENKMLYISRD